MKKGVSQNLKKEGKFEQWEENGEENQEYILENIPNVVGGKRGKRNEEKFERKGKKIIRENEG
jgi:hypothetical protein